MNYKFQTLSIIICLSLMIGGCNLNQNEKDIEPGKYISLACVAAGMAKVAGPDSPLGPNTPDVTPDEDVPLAKDCDNCNGRGWIGDGRPQDDCPVCDNSRPPDGNPDDPFRSGNYKNIGSEKDADWIDVRSQEYKEIIKEQARYKNDRNYEFRLPTLEELELKVDLEWLDDTKSAIELAKKYDRQILVVLDKQAPADKWFTHVLGKYLQDNYILLYNDISIDSIESQWTKSFPSTFIKDKKFIQPVFCVLTKDGNVISYNKDNKSEFFREIQQDSLDILSDLKLYSLTNKKNRGKNEEAN